MTQSFESWPLFPDSLTLGTFKAAWRNEPRAGDLGALGLLRWAADPRLRAEHFRHARMILTFLTDRYLFSHREHWFPLGP